MGATATPIINNLTEGVKLLEMVLLKKYDDLETTPTFKNALQIFKHITINSIRYIPKYGIKRNQQIISIDGNSLKPELCKAKTILEFYQVILNEKLKGITQYLTDGTTIYTGNFRSGLINVIKKYVENLGFKVSIYTGANTEMRDIEKKNFIQKKTNIFICNSAVSFGLDGLQHRSNTIIPIILPWTNSEWEQFIGRFDRRGSSFKEINIYIPQVLLLIIKIKNGP